MAGQGVIEIADRIHKGRVSKTIADLRADGVSHERVASTLNVLYDLNVNRLSVLRYLRRTKTETS